MTQQADRLYDLLPYVYRLRDTEAGQPLRALLQVIAEQVAVVEEDITQLYENWFIETCEDWVVPYVADLIGFRLVHEAGEPAATGSPESTLRNRALIPRREVANTIRYRRRKGALSLLELLAMDVTAWPTRAVEFYRLLGWTQNINHLHRERARTVNLRQSDALDRINGPFDELGHTVDVRRPNAHRTTGRHNIPSVGLFSWRLKAYPLTKAPALSLDDQRPHYTFSVLGNNTPLFTRATTEPTPTHIADEMNVPAPIRRRAFDERTADYYGRGKSICIWQDDLEHPVSIDRIVPADLSHWAYQPQGDQVAVDPQLGRISFSPQTEINEGVWVSYHYGFSADIGGGEYDRHLRPLWGRAVYRVSQQRTLKKGFKSITEALAAWADEKPQPSNAVIEIEDSESYVEPVEINLKPGQRLEIRAANLRRPAISLINWRTSRVDAVRVTGPKELKPSERAPRLTLDGLLIAGRSVQVRGRLAEVTIRHCTLVPGWSLDHECEPENENEPSLELINTNARLNLERSITGTIEVTADEVLTDPINILLSDSVLDATAPALDALTAPGGRYAHAVLKVLRSTIFGRTSVHAIELAENSIFDGFVRVARSQFGCVRFCYVPPGSRTPRRYHCQPDLAVAAIPHYKKHWMQKERAEVELCMRPQFTSERYGTPAYCQLAATCAEEIKRGADDESEMGVFHDLFQPQREANLRARLDEYTPAGFDAGIIFAT
jgi:hypothetical protein